MNAFEQEAVKLMAFVRLANSHGDYMIEGEDANYVIPGHNWVTVREQLKRCDAAYKATYVPEATAE